MLASSRETIFRALFAQLKTAVLTDPKTPKFKYFTRRARFYADVKPEQRPALVQVEVEEDYVQTSSGQPPMVYLDAKVFIYIDVAQYIDNESTPSISILNQYIDAIDAAMRPSLLTWRQDLGGVVDNAWIEGKVQKDSGDTDGTAAALIPVRLTVPA